MVSEPQRESLQGAWQSRPPNHDSTHPPAREEGRRQVTTQTLACTTSQLRYPHTFTVILFVFVSAPSRQRKQNFGRLKSDTRYKDQKREKRRSDWDDLKKKKKKEKWKCAITTVSRPLQRAASSVISCSLETLMSSPVSFTCHSCTRLMTAGVSTTQRIRPPDIKRSKLWTVLVCESHLCLLRAPSRLVDLRWARQMPLYQFYVPECRQEILN